MKKIIITGCPRSGTRRLQSAFGFAKVPASHERDGEITISCALAVDTDNYISQHEPYWSRELDEVWHQVRDPLLCIPSMATTIPSRFWAWQYPLTGLHPKAFRSMREFAAHFWVRWNLETERRGPVYRFRIEDLESEWPVMWERLELGEATPIDPRHKEYKHKGADDAREKPEPVTYEELCAFGPSIHDSVREMAERYGYEV